MEGSENGYRSYTELKEELAKTNLRMKTDNEVIKEIFSEYQMHNCTEERKLQILEELEYYVHQVRPGVVQQLRYQFT